MHRAPPRSSRAAQPRRQPARGRDAQIRYTKVANGEILATAKFAEGVDAVRERLDADGVADFEVEVELADSGGDTVAAMTVTWNVKRQPA